MELFTTFVYQPFFNLLVLFYYMLEHIPGVVPDMGVAVVLFTIAIRIILLPISIAGTRSRKERHEIQTTIYSIQQDTSISPDQAKKRVKKIFRANRRILISEAVNFFIQMIIFFILYRIFTTGLAGADLHLIYPFMPEVELPFNLLFLGRYDLTHTNILLNLIQSLAIVATEAVSLIDSPFPVTRNDLVRYLIILPIASFLLFMFLPAGKKLFIITTLCFSFLFTVTNILSREFSRLFGNVEEAQAQAIGEQTFQK